VRGQFTSEDPVFLGNPSQQNLQDPQSLNAYSYAEDSPVVKKDPNGKQVWEEVLGGVLIGSVIAEEAAPTIESIESEMAPTLSESTEATQASGSFYGLPSPESFQESIGWPSSEPSEFTSIPWKVNTPLLTAGSISSLLLWALYDFYDPIQQEYGDTRSLTGSTQNLMTQPLVSNYAQSYSQVFEQNVQEIQNSTTLQSRSSAVSSVNASSDSTSNQSKLWVTPSGAVVTWGGQLVAGPVNNK
jgi:hypothetical protein